jgi:acyl-CoA thioesterase
MTDTILDRIRQKIASDPYARLLEIELKELQPGYAQATMQVKETMLNFHGITHGAALFSLADAAFAAASNSHGQTAVALNVNISYLAATQAGSRLTATAVEEKSNKRTALYRIVIEDEVQGLVAVAEGLVYRKQKSLLDQHQQDD